MQKNNPYEFDDDDWLSYVVGKLLVTLGSPFLLENIYILSI